MAFKSVCVLMARLLAERFALAVHHEMREMPVYFLRLSRDDGRLGKQLVKSSVDCSKIEEERKQTGGTAPSAPSTPAGPPVCGSLMKAQPKPTGMVLRYLASSTTVAALAAWLPPYVLRPVIDRTALTGAFDLDFAFAMGPQSPDSDAVPVFTAIQEQLGLKLESSREPVDVVVVDHAELPTPD